MHSTKTNSRSIANKIVTGALLWVPWIAFSMSASPACGVEPTVAVAQASQLGPSQIDSASKPKKKRPSFPGAKKVSLKSQVVKANAGKLRLKVQLNLPPGSKLNPLAPMGYLLETVNDKGPIDRSSPSKYQKINPPKETFELLVPVLSEGSERLRLSMNYYHCQGDPATGICKTGAVIWDIPFQVVSEANGNAKPKEMVEIKYDIPKS